MDTDVKAISLVHFHFVIVNLQNSRININRNLQLKQNQANLYNRIYNVRSSSCYFQSYKLILIILSKTPEKYNCPMFSRRLKEIHLYNLQMEHCIFTA